MAVDQAVAGEVEGLDLDLHQLAGVDEAHVAVGQLGLDGQVAAVGDDDHQMLGGGDHPAQGVDGQLVHHPVDGRAQQSAAGLVLGLDQLLAQLVLLLLGLAQVGEEVGGVLGAGGVALLDQGAAGVEGLGAALFLHPHLMPRLGQLLLGVEVGEAGAEALLGQFPVDALLVGQHRDLGIDLVDLGADLGGLGALLADLLAEVGELGGLLVVLGAHGLAGLGDHVGRGALGDGELGRAAVFEGVGEGGQPGHVEFGLGQVVGDAHGVRPGLGRVELDQQLAGFDMVAVLHMDGPHHPRVQGLDGLDVPGGDQPPGRRGQDVDLAEHRPQDRDGEEEDDDQAEGAAGGRGRGLHHLQGRGQEFALVVAVVAFEEAAIEIGHSGPGAHSAASAGGSPDCRRQSRA